MKRVEMGLDNVGSTSYLIALESGVGWGGGI